MTRLNAFAKRATLENTARKVDTITAVTYFDYKQKFTGITKYLHYFTMLRYDVFFFT